MDEALPGDPAQAVEVRADHEHLKMRLPALTPSGVAMMAGGLVDDLEPTLLVHGHVHPYGGHPTDKAIGTHTTSVNVVGYCQFDIDPGHRDFTIVRRRYGA